MQRELEPYAAPTDTVSGLPIIGAGGLLVLPGILRIQPTPYRYAVLIERARQGYFKAAEALQAKFISSVIDEGWPISGKVRQLEVFDRFVGQWLKERQKVAFFMVDALRYE